MKLSLRKPRLLPVPTTIISMKIAQNCFCGAQFALEVPIFYKGGEVEFATDFNEQLEYWHSNHFHQTNPQLNSVIDGIGVTEAIADSATVKELGFRVPNHKTD